MPFSALIVSGGIYLMLPGGVEAGYLPLSTPHPYGVCQEDRDRAVWLKHRLEQLLEEPTPDIKGTLLKEGLAKEYPYNWCIPKYQIRHTIAYWLTNQEVYTQGKALIPIFHKPRGTTQCRRSSTCATTSRAVTPVTRPSATRTPPCISSRKEDARPSAGCIFATPAARRSG